MVEIELELAPAASATPEMRQLVSDACERSGVDASFVPVEGDGRAETSAGRWADPSLSIVLRSESGLSGMASIKEVHDELTGALVRIRTALPSLPLGLRTVTPSNAGASGRLLSYGESVVTLSIEAADEIRQRVCPDCGRPFSTVHGYIYKDDDAYAAYHAVLQTDHPSTVADMALSFGSWEEEATSADRQRVGVRVWPDDDQLKMRINDPGDSSWGDSETLGRMATRDEVIGTFLEQEALRAVEFVIAHDDRVSEHLR